MTILEILQAEQYNSNSVHLYKEGAFWKAYEKSAYLIARKMGYKVFWKSSRACPEGVVYVGFPETALRSIQNVTERLVYSSAKERVYACSESVPESIYVDWKNTVRANV